MTDMSNKITIVIPCHNLAEYVRETIDSVNHACNRQRLEC